jgi:rubredoxin
MEQWICTVCGYIHEDEQPPDQCPVCASPASKFEEFFDDDDFEQGGRNGKMDDDDDEFYGEFDEP